MTPEDAVDEIDKGIAAVETALNGVCDHDPVDAIFPLSRLLT